MFDLFRKKKVIDFTPYKKDIKKPEDIQDFTNVSGKQEDNSLGFLGAMASSADSGMQNIENLHIKDLKVKLEDVEYKLDNFAKKLSSMMDRVDLLEKKVDRDLRRGV